VPGRSERSGAWGPFRGPHVGHSRRSASTAHAAETLLAACAIIPGSRLRVFSYATAHMTPLAKTLPKPATP